MPTALPSPVSCRPAGVAIVGLLLGIAALGPAPSASSVVAAATPSPAQALAARMSFVPGPVAVAVVDTGLNPADRGRLGVSTHLEPDDPAFVDDPGDVKIGHAALVAQALRGATSLTSVSGPLEVPIIDVRVTGSYGSGGLGTVYPRWGGLLAAAIGAGARVANFSFVSDDVGICAETAAHPEVTFVAAAGNGGVDLSRRLLYPAACPNTITVTTVDALTAKASGNTGNGVDLAAPTTLVTDPSGVAWGGTSMAAGYASGVVATLLAINPALTPAGVEELLCRTARPSTDLAPPVTRCGGMIDAAAAMEAAGGSSPIRRPDAITATVDGAVAIAPVHPRHVAKRPIKRAVAAARSRSATSRHRWRRPRPTAR